MNQLQILEVASLYLRKLKEQGLSVEYSTDFEAVPEDAREFERNFQMPGFDVSRVDHTEKTAFWLYLKDGDQRIGGAAAMLQDIGRENFIQYQKRISRHHFPNRSGAALDWVAPPLGEKLSGRLAYIGELTFQPGRRGKRDRLASFMRLLQVLAITQWNVDWVYAFIPERHIQARLDLVYGFTQSLSAAQKWTTPEPELRCSTEWWVGAPRSELEHILQADLLGANVL
ncbi:hypothetical protein [Parasedimentitalea maritima]|uniref:Uncharacterized protein n=1 Tax=Parasedimentitalea maritima TaxID=2578117 RepID=A0A6A4RDI1_9RHOB|nr:hypothetical protein [Zongyanglinia marina]KAE9631753.1 hypothetical protein GP644_05465 [Zongyanglinia marina]